MRNMQRFSNLTLAALGLSALLVPSVFLWNIAHVRLYQDLIQVHARAYQMDPILITALIKTESHFSPKAVSKQGAVGLMQVLPGTARGIAPSAGIRDFHEAFLTDPEINIRIGTAYLAALRRMFGNDETLVLAAYNAGPRVAQSWPKKGEGLTLAEIPFPETRTFVRQVQATRHRLRLIKKLKDILTFHAS